MKNARAEKQTMYNQAPRGHQVLWNYSLHEINNTVNLLERYKEELKEVLNNPDSSEFKRLKAINRVQRTALSFINIEL